MTRWEALKKRLKARIERDTQEYSHLAFLEESAQEPHEKLNRLVQGMYKKGELNGYTRIINTMDDIEDIQKEDV